jgi:hypothetical protein
MLGQLAGALLERRAKELNEALVQKAAASLWVGFAMVSQPLCHGDGPCCASAQQRVLITSELVATTRERRSPAAAKRR